jgi:phthiodiolone/phenolphthiodiolone dimycocerosates ketoreductase
LSNSSGVKTASVVWGDRYAGPAALRQQVQALQASGVVDYLQISDQYGNFIPSSLWTPATTPMAAAVPDPNSLMDAVAVCGYALGASSDMGVILSTDSIRRGPVEFTSLALTLADMTQGRAHLWVGSGEVKNIRPLGYKRQGLGKLEDTFRGFQQMWNDVSPADFEGNYWNLKGATVGAQRGHKPQIWGMGEGPRLLDIATSYADGLASAVPLKFQTPGDCAGRMALIRDMLEKKDRDPDRFETGMVMMVLAHPDPNVVDKALDSPVVRWMTALMGRVGSENWRIAGLESPVPEGWTYYADYVTTRADDSFVQETLSNVTRKHVETSWIWGTPDQVAAKLWDFAESGLSILTVANYLPMAVDPETAGGAFVADIEICGRLKALSASPAPTLA